jgi:hypothetical protein
MTRHLTQPTKEKAVLESIAVTWMMILSFGGAGLAAVLAIWTMLSPPLNRAERAEQVLLWATVACILYILAIFFAATTTVLSRKPMRGSVIAWFVLTCLPLMPFFPWDLAAAASLTALIGVWLLQWRHRRYQHCA